MRTRSHEEGSDALKYLLIKGRVTQNNDRRTTGFQTSKYKIINTRTYALATIFLFIFTGISF